MQTRASSTYEVVSSNQICIFVVEDPTIYRLDLTSSCGSLITNDVASTVLTATVTADRKDITKDCTLVWKKYLYDLNVPILDESWGKDINSSEVIINRDDIDAKCKIECEAYLVGNDGNQYRVAGDYVTLLDVNDLRPSPTEPLFPKEGELWLDTSVEPPVLRIYKNGKWVSLTNQIENIEGLMETLDSLKDKITDLEFEVSAGLLSIDYNTDYLFEYNENVSSTTGVAPINNYKTNVINRSIYKFDASIFIDILDKNNLIYDKSILKNNHDFTINMHVKPGNQIIAKDIYRLLSTGDNIDNAFLTIWNYYPNSSDPNNESRRLCVEFGLGDNSQKQSITLTSPKTITDWIMLTITFEYEKKEIAIYMDGKIWGLKQLTKINDISHFGFKRSGWYYENVAILNKALTPLQIKEVYEHNKPFKDYRKHDIIAPTPSIIEFEL